MPNDPAVRPERLILIGNHASRRVSGFAEMARRLEWTVEIISYADLFHGRCSLKTGDVVRLESPGECPETSRLILRAGKSAMESAGKVPVSDQQIQSLKFSRGEILHPLQWFHGFKQILTSIQTRCSDLELRWMSTPDSIATAFDKLACLDLWNAAGLPVPHRYPTPSTYAELRNTITDRHARLFLKLRYGYSAIGAVALEWRDSRVRAITTVEVTWSDGRPRMFVSKKPRVLLREFEIAWLIDTLAMEDIIVEDWLPKARWHGCPYDVRVITIGGDVHHAVGRANASPFTNLNLDARRIPRNDLAEHLGDAWTCVESLCASAAAEIPEASMLGIDLLIRPGHWKFALLEANAFGDYLPGLYYRGMSTWETQLRNLSAEQVDAS